MSYSSKLTEYLNSQKDEMISDLAGLVAVPSVMGECSKDAPFGEEPKRALLKMLEMCDKSGFVTRNYENAVGFAQLGEGEAELGILCHLDVVPANEAGWETPPFELTEKNGVLYGRGAIDDKGPAVAALYALKAVKELGVPLGKSVRLIFGTNEENGSRDLDIYKERDKFPKNVFTPDGSFPVINIEKGMARSVFSADLPKGALISFRGGNIPNAVPDYAECELRGVSLADFQSESAKRDNGAVFEAETHGEILKIKCRGRAAHASTPETGINAITALVSLLNRLIDEPLLKGLERKFPFGETDGGALGIKCSDEKSGALTCVLSILLIEAADACPNELRARLTVDARFPAQEKLDNVLNAEINSLRDIDLGISTFLGDEPHIVPEDSPFVQRLMSVYERVEGEKGRCIAIGGGTYVHNIEGGVAFGAERGDTDYNMHGDNEFITAEELLKDAALFAEAIIEICGQAGEI